MDYTLINLLSKSTLDVIRRDLYATEKKLCSRIKAEEKAKSLKDSGNSLVVIAEIETSIRRDRHRLEKIAVQIDFIESAQLRRVA